jgi:nucleoside-diphosphate-sugar epimerase
MARILVTGGAGFIGSNLVKKLVEEGHRDIRVIDDLSTGKRENLAPVIGSIDFKLGDIRDMDFVEKQLRDTEIVFHNAALTSVDQSVKDPIATSGINITGTFNVLLAARDNKVKRVVYASSSSLYGDSPTLPKHEEMPANPLSPYAFSKYVGERYCQLFCRLYGVETICFRYFNVFGPNQDAGSSYAAVIPRFISAIMNDKPVTIYGDGEQTRDFTYVENVVEANLLAASIENGIGETFNIACGERISINQLAKHLMDVLGRIVPVINEEVRPGDVKHSQANITKAVERLRYSPAVDVWEGLRRTVSLADSSKTDP